MNSFMWTVLYTMYYLSAGIPGGKDSRENAVQICPICKFQATTKNPYRHLQDHLARVHFKERIAADLPTKKPYVCPIQGCEDKNYPDWQVSWLYSYISAIIVMLYS